MLDTIVLFTPLHTGTHFVRMLLEAHPRIDTAIAEDYRIDRLYRPGHILAGKGKGSVDAVAPIDRYQNSEQLLLEPFRAWLAGECSWDRFQQALEYWCALRAETTLPLTNAEHSLAQVRREFQSLGIDLDEKQPVYRLYRAHCHSFYGGYDLSKLTTASTVVATVRHPLWSILTILRREPPDQHEALVQDLLDSVKIIFSLPGAFLFCTDLWQAEPQRMEALIDFLELPLVPAVTKYIALRPRVNSTVSSDEEHGPYNYCFEFGHSPEFAAGLKEARQMLVAGKIHRLLEPFWGKIVAFDVLQHYRRLGYQL